VVIGSGRGLPFFLVIEESMDFAGAVASAAQALNVVKGLRDIDSAMNVVDLKAKMADLYGKLAEVRIALTDAPKKNFAQKSLRSQS
jgi:hypothetical protein